MAEGTTPAQQWLALLRKLERERGNAVLAMLEAKRQRPDLWRAWNGEKQDGGQMELFTTEQPSITQNAAIDARGALDDKP